MKVSDNIKKSISPILTTISIFFAIIACIFLIDTRVEKKVENILNSETFINKLISEIHPSIIFDENASILNDIGGMKYIKNIRITKAVSKFNLQDTLINQIIIEPNIVLTSPPLIECLDHGDIYVFSPQRGEGYTWIYKTELQQFDRPRKVNRFLLEIIK